ncbi:MAG: phosphatidylserine decarboxylase [Alphaproteobacteria bacterium GM202ARS2]|nr:phosphatidylserine decarboxylase [Alphaproteobacteria bacterium GM202ARS2]
MASEQNNQNKEKTSLIDELQRKGLFESISALFRSIMVPVHPDGWVFVLSFAGVSFFLSLFSESLGFLGILLTAWCFYFFRDPERVAPSQQDEEDAIVSSADGLIVSVLRCPPPSESSCGEQEMNRISVFMNVFDVHVNRMPFRGIVKSKTHVPGTFLNAMLERASVQNERVVLDICRSDGVFCVVVQVAGLLARRIRCDVDVDDDVDCGQRFGLIRFGSRVDIYMPVQAKVHVREGQRAVAGETILASLPLKAKSAAPSAQPKT